MITIPEHLQALSQCLKKSNISCSTLGQQRLDHANQIRERDAILDSFERLHPTAEIALVKGVFIAYIKGVA